MKRILVAVDLSPITHDVISAAAAECRESGGVLHLLYVSTRSEALSDFEWEREQLEVLAALLRLEGSEARARVAHGDPAEEILAEIDRLEADLVVVGSHGEGALYDEILGGVAEVLHRRAPCRLLIVPAFSGGAGHTSPSELVQPRWI
jgi:nucleotide-binding universal stress UspA family protein